MLVVATEEVQRAVRLITALAAAVLSLTVVSQITILPLLCQETIRLLVPIAAIRAVQTEVHLIAAVAHPQDPQWVAVLAAVAIVAVLAAAALPVEEVAEEGDSTRET